MGFDVAFPPSRSARFLERLNRFVVLAETGAGKLRLHLPNTGRLRWLRPGTALRFLPRKGGRTAGRVLLAREGDVWVLLDSSWAEAALPRLVERWGWSWLGAQPRLEGHRLDGLILDETGEKRFLEMKSATHVEAGRACFPDAPSTRARAHLKLLAERQGVLVFAVLRGDARGFAPCPADPAFAAALASALAAGLRARAVRVRVKKAGLVWGEELPIYC
ncbi:DNA/RNA nuclease SfsA [Oceanithermus sp.]